MYCDVLYVFLYRAVFGYDGKTYDLKVVETGGNSSLYLPENVVFIST